MENGGLAAASQEFPLGFAFHEGSWVLQGLPAAVLETLGAADPVVGGRTSMVCVIP